MHIRTIIIICGISVVAVANAGSISANYTYGLGITTVKFTASFGGNQRLGTTQFRGTRTGGTDNLVPNVFRTYCVEVGEKLAQGNRTHPNVSPLLGSSTDTGGISGPVLFDAARTANMEKLWGNYYGLIGSNASLSAAFQLAQWEVAFDNDLSLVQESGAKLWVKSEHYQVGITDVAAGWLSAIKNGSATTRTNLLLLSGPGIQDQITIVPEPATMAAIGIGLAALIRRRNRDKK